MRSRGGGLWKERKAELGIRSDGKGAAVSNRVAGRGLGKNLEGGKPKNKVSVSRSVGLLPQGRLIPPRHGDGYIGQGGRDMTTLCVTPTLPPSSGGSEVSLLRSLTPVGAWMVGVGEMGGAAGQTWREGQSRGV